ncbi:hypothetical protein Q8W37_20170 [Shimia thalassica]|uniref:hypothetical protein n=1 Tax=Shimia thalassica TaxID=1715693 RepID=UPI002734FB85|nr:hypothetical protein [Shimia thalassica]MDP2582264.1 hypothetical protein [Shimia thalassica]
MAIATSDPNFEGSPFIARVLSGLLASVLLLASFPIWSTFAQTSLGYWFNSTTEYPAFAQQLDAHGAFGSDATRQIAVGLITLSITVGSILAPVLLALIALDRLESAKRAIGIILSVSAAVFGFSYLYYLGGFGGAGTQLGSIAMNIHAGSTLAFVAIFVAYRYLEALKKGDAVYRNVFAKQLIIVALSPWLFQVGYGLWFLVLGHSFDAGYWQQLVISFGSFLLPMLVIYMNDTLGSQGGKRSTLLLIAAVALCLLGTYGYATSDIQPALI